MSFNGADVTLRSICFRTCPQLTKNVKCSNGNLPGVYKYNYLITKKENEVGEGKAQRSSRSCETACQNINSKFLSFWYSPTDPNDHCTCFDSNIIDENNSKKKNNGLLYQSQARKKKVGFKVPDAVNPVKTLNIQSESTYVTINECYTRLITEKAANHEDLQFIVHDFENFECKLYNYKSQDPEVTFEKKCCHFNFVRKNFSNNCILRQRLL